MAMINQTEKAILRIVSKNELIKERELLLGLKKAGLQEIEKNIKRLTEDGYIRAIQSFGTRYLLTQRGMKALKK
jgi:predicted transcriptional regulator